MSIQIYAACLAAYNEGYLHGAWIDATQSAENIQAEIDKMLKASPIRHAEEWAIHDSEGLGDIREHEPLNTIAERAAFIEEHGEAAIAYLNRGIGAIAEFEDCYIGEYESMLDYAYELVDDCGMLENVPEPLKRYFDYEAYARDLEIELTTENHDGKVYIFNP